MKIKKTNGIRTHTMIGIKYQQKRIDKAEDLNKSNKYITDSQANINICDRI